VTAAKEVFSNSQNSNVQKWGAYVAGDLKRQEYLERAGCKSFRNLSQAQIADLIGKLEVRLADKKSKQS
jgi:hypothetical protein